MIEILERNELHILYLSNLVLLVTNSLFPFQYCQESKAPLFPSVWFSIGLWYVSVLTIEDSLP